jgi:hypothetical protein
LDFDLDLDFCFLLRDEPSGGGLVQKPTPMPKVSAVGSSTWHQCQTMRFQSLEELEEFMRQVLKEVGRQFAEAETLAVEVHTLAEKP